MIDEGEDSYLLERQTLVSHLLDAVKQCQIRFGGRGELATETDSRVVCLCAQFEAVLQHGLRRNNKRLSAIRHMTDMVKGLNMKHPDSEPTFWHFVRNHLNKHEYERYMLLKNISTDIGRGRAWLRSALNEHSLERNMHMFLADTSVISQYYENWAFLADEERSSMLPTMSAGLGSVLFAINIDNPDLNTSRTIVQKEPQLSCTESQHVKLNVEPLPVVVKSVGRVPENRKKRRKKPVAQVVSFDDDEVKTEDERSVEWSHECYSAPPTCMSSPVSSSGNFPDLDRLSTYSNVSLSVSNKSSPHLERNESDKLNDGADGQMNLHATTNSQSLISSIGITVKKGSPLSSSVNMSMTSSDSSGDVCDQPSGSENSFPVNELSIKTKQDVEANNSSVIISDSAPSHTNSRQKNDTKKFIKQSNPLEPKREDFTNGNILMPILGSSEFSVPLIPLSQGDDIPSGKNSASIPSYGDEMENAAAALAMTQKISGWANSSGGKTHTKEQKITEPRTRSDTMTMSADELREALLTVLQRKTEAEEQISSLRSLLHQEMELNAGLRAEIKDVKKDQEEKNEKIEAKFQTVTRENELLKHQLKKYITAVQMLKRDGIKGHEVLKNMIGEIEPAVPEPKLYIDHHYEASEYEKKLVQVAEMHGELLEFNEQLHRQLVQRETTIRRLREELIDLRGPFPEENQTSDDDVSVTSDYDASSQLAISRPLINIWIPSAFLTGRSSDVHHVYQVYIRIKDEEWNIYRRYAQFYALHKALKRRNTIVNSFDFPPKKSVGNKDSKVVEERRRRLQHYLRCVVNWFLQHNPDLASNADKEMFLSILPFFGYFPPLTLPTIPPHISLVLTSAKHTSDCSVEEYRGSCVACHTTIG
ncbi:sorting nexin-29-like isoform X3 [Limulus polyphemus]|uniref:Sorting nexin-29-like isoform X3 n=1 Tax=Limulus polyphemus TaxID=6850 RepID=A0ABM1SWX2_LIMPO|nr:sorting nexin-29-like isoform X3 [Limulus polyphemus]